MAQHNDARQHRQRTRARDQKRLQGRAPRTLVIRFETDQQIRGNRRDFPKNKQRDQVI